MKHKGFRMALLSTLLIMVAFSLGAQPQKEKNREKIEAQEVGFITKELQLSPEEAKVFWPVYDEYKAKRKELSNSYRGKMGGREPDFEKMTEAQCTEFADNQIALEEKLFQLKKEYHKKFKEILPASKVMKLYRAEREFKAMLMKQMQGRKGQGKGPGPGPGPGPGGGPGLGPGWD